MKSSPGSTTRFGGGPFCKQGNVKHIMMFHCIAKVHGTLTMQPPTQGGQPLVVTKQPCFQLSGCNRSQDKPCRCIKDLIQLPRQSDQNISCSSGTGWSGKICCKTAATSLSKCLVSDALAFNFGKGVRSIIFILSWFNLHLLRWLL